MTAGDNRKPPPDLRLPGSVAEILASPEGPGIGAFFDLDGTLVAGSPVSSSPRSASGAGIWGWVS